MSSPFTSLRPVSLFGLAALFLAGGCVRGTSSDSSGSLIFSHEVHAEEADCGDCHDGVEASTAGTRGAFIPKKAACESCHDDAIKEEAGCVTCHKGAREGIAWPRPDRALKFNHAAHIARGGKCVDCHAKAGAGRMAVGGHATCNTAACHAKDYKQLRCDGCHETLRKEGVRTVSELRHGPGFAKNHGIQAKQNTRACAQCHDQTYCADCHAGTSAAAASIIFPEKVERGFIHRGDYLTRHAVEARSRPDSCRKCHGQNHCRSCHALQGVASAVTDKPATASGRKVHPAGWLTRGSARFHGAAARVGINRCASCHDKGGKSSCVGCHSVGGAGGKPHPPGWASRDRASECRSKAMCQTCHTAGKGCPL